MADYLSTGGVTGLSRCEPAIRAEEHMRSVGLAAILLSVLVFLFPWYGEWVPFVSISTTDSRIVGGLLLAVGALTLAVYRR